MEKIIFRLKNSKIWMGFLLIIMSIVILSRFSIYKIKGNSMFDSIQEGDIVLVWKKLNFQTQYKKSQIVLFKKKVNELTSSYVKRVAAIPGDSIIANTQELLIDKSTFPHDVVYHLISDSIENNNVQYFKYLMEQPGECGKEKFLVDKTLYDSTKLIVPFSCYFMIGDNPYESMDSRFWGFIHESQIVGEVVAIFNVR